MSVTEEVKSRLDIVQYIQQSGVSLKKAGKRHKACCPFHNEQTPSFVINEDTQTWYCFGACAEGGDIFSYAMKRHGWTFKEALEDLAKIAGVELEKRTPQQVAQQESFEKLRGILQAACDAYHDYLLSKREDARIALAYLQEKRGLTLETIQKFQMGYVPDGWDNLLSHLTQLGYTEEDIIEVGLAIRNEQGRVYDRFRNRIIVPIRDDRGRVVGFGGRVLKAEDQPKYINSPQTPLFDKSRILFGLDVAKDMIRKSEIAVIVEGYMDVIQAHQAGHTNVIAQMGTAMTDSQLRLITPRYAKKLIFALDADVAGQTATERSLEVAQTALEKDWSGRLSVDIRILQVPDGKDPDDFLREHPEEWQKIVDSAPTVADYLVNDAVQNLPGDASIQEREAVAKKLAQILTASENDLYNQNNLQKLAMRLRLPENSLMSVAWKEKRHKEQSAKRQPPSFPEFPLDEPPPPELFDIPPGESAPVKRTQNTYELEYNCLRVLIHYPQFYYQVNRKLRELAHGDEALLRGFLCAFTYEDFMGRDYQEIMKTFERALEQDEMDLVLFVEQDVTDESLSQELSSLWIDEQQMFQKHLMGRMEAELSSVLRELRKDDQLQKLTHQFMFNALQLRAKRVQRDRENLFFLQNDAWQEKDREKIQHLVGLIHLSMQAKSSIEAELSYLQNFL